MADRRKITYGELGQLIGHPPLFLGAPLDVLRDEILERHHLPRIDALVVNAETLEVGDNFYKGGRGQMSDEDYRALLDDERVRVIAYGNWGAVIPRLLALYRPEQGRPLGERSPLGNNG